MGAARGRTLPTKGALSAHHDRTHINDNDDNGSVQAEQTTLWTYLLVLVVNKCHPLLYLSLVPC